MKYLKYFESASSDLKKENKFLTEVATRCQRIYKNILPEFVGDDYIKDMYAQDNKVKNIYGLINNLSHKFYPQFSSLKKINYDVVLDVMGYRLDEIISDKSWDLFSYNMFNLYMSRYAYILVGHNEYYMSKVGIKIEREPQDKGNEDIFAKLEYIIYDEWTNVISKKEPSDISDSDIINTVNKMDIAIQEFENTPVGQKWKQKIQDENLLASEISKSPIKTLPLSIKRMHLDKAPISKGGHWSKSTLEAPLEELPKKHWFPPKIN